ELYRNVMAILNKLTPQKFKTLMEQFLALNIDTPERLEGVIDRIFEKVLLLCNQRMSIPLCKLNKRNDKRKLY
ncbi:eukaryotic translation initiation factor 4 gamma 3-like isoform X2, partial [Paramuricea clavata]